MHKEKVYRYTAISLGLLGTLNFLALGFYICDWSFNLASFDFQSFVLKGYLAFGLTLTGVILLSYGNFKTWRGHPLEGGFVNLIAGFLLIFFVFYFTFITQPSFLKWLEPLAYLLALPPLLSGILATYLHKTLRSHKDFSVV
jgi:hypothetical protein